tara:strand:+ start:325 stop:531 length:207 start_codon:yes stop_codon:yes gene_type:complete
MMIKLNHGIKLKHPFLLILTFILLDVICVVWLKIGNNLISYEAGKFVLTLWICGFFIDDFCLDKSKEG